ncbi:MAG: UDP-N-acetylmuramate dehydrogenase [Frankiales bacterium]|nr:UDP-N-acetylmuramate dehydrogenase [Frankiales bacterium]
MTVLLSSLTTLGLGGPAKRLVRAGSTDELVAALRQCDTSGEQVLLLGGGSNVVVADAGFPGTVVKVASSGLDLDGTVVRVDAGVSWDAVVAETVDRGLSGFEALSGIPGSAGATPIQNVGAYGQEVADTLVSVSVMDRMSGAVREVTAAECGLAYRTSVFKHQTRYVVLSATFRLRDQGGRSEPIRYAELARALGVEVGERAALGDVRRAVLELRHSKSMLIDPADPDSRSVGSFFTNPVLTAEEHAKASALAGVELPSYEAADGRKVPAAWLIERAGFGKGWGDGKVGISTRHTLALVNRGGGTTAELLDLARVIRAGVDDRFGVMLSPEPVFVGTSL